MYKHTYFQNALLDFSEASISAVGTGDFFKNIRLFYGLSSSGQRICRPVEFNDFFIVLGKHTFIQALLKFYEKRQTNSGLGICLGIPKKEP